jgi:hypothetical protein
MEHETVQSLTQTIRDMQQDLVVTGEEIW